MTDTPKYLLFAGDHCYPSGGWEDFEGEYDTLDEAKAAVEAQYGTETELFPGYSTVHTVPTGWDWAHIVHHNRIVGEWIRLARFEPGRWYANTDTDGWTLHDQPIT